MFLALLPIVIGIPTAFGQGVISCQDDYDYSGIRPVFVHYPSISTPSTTYVGGPYTSHCHEVIGGGIDYSEN